MKSMTDLEVEKDDLAKKYETNPNLHVHDDNDVKDDFEKPNSDKDIKLNFSKKDQAQETEK